MVRHEKRCKYKMIDQLNSVFESISKERHIVIFRESMQKLLMFWTCIGITLLVAKYATSFPIGQLSSIAVMIMMASYVYAISSGIARSHNTSPTACGLACVFVCFLCSYQTITDKPLQDYVIWVILALVLGEVYGFLSGFHFENRIMPEAAADYLSDLFPCIGTMLLGLFIVFLSPLFFPMIRNIFLSLAHALDSLAAVIVLILLTTIGKLFFPKLPKIVRAVVRPFWVYMSLANLYAFFHKGAYPFITSESFFHWFVWIGGAGAAIGLALDLFLLSKKDRRKSMYGYIREALFNQEDLLMDEVIEKHKKSLVIPFTVTPVVLAVMMYLATANGMLKPSRLMSPWMLPGPLGAFLATGLDARAIYASLIGIVISMVIYLPFVLHILHRKED